MSRCPTCRLPAWKRDLRENRAYEKAVEVLRAAAEALQPPTSQPDAVEREEVVQEDKTALCSLSSSEPPPSEGSGKHVSRARHHGDSEAEAAGMRQPSISDAGRKRPDFALADLKEDPAQPALNEHDARTPPTTERLPDSYLQFQCLIARACSCSTPAVPHVGFDLLPAAQGEGGPDPSLLKLLLSLEAQLPTPGTDEAVLLRRDLETLEGWLEEAEAQGAASSQPPSVAAEKEPPATSRCLEEAQEPLPQQQRDEDGGCRQETESTGRDATLLENRPPALLSALSVRSPLSIVTTLVDEGIKQRLRLLCKQLGGASVSKEVTRCMFC